MFVWNSRPTTSRHYILYISPVFIIPCGRNFGGQAWYVEAKINLIGFSFLAWLVHSCSLLSLPMRPRYLKKTPRKIRPFLPFTLVVQARDPLYLYMFPIQLKSPSLYEYKTNSYEIILLFKYVIKY